MNKIYLGMGSNLGDRSANLRFGLRELGAQGVGISRISSVYETEPVGFVDQGRFLNLALETLWKREARDLLRCCLEVEKKAGRIRDRENGPRILDIDILLFGARILREPDLEIPHSRLHLRRFVLVPLSEIAPRAVHPVYGLTAQELLGRCPDSSGVWKIAEPFDLERDHLTGYNPAASRGERE